MTNSPTPLCSWLIAAHVLVPSAFAQAPKTPTFAIPATNPPAVVKQRLAATDIEISYNRPSVKGRTIFGTLIPYGAVWRTGSDNATQITFSTPVKLNGTDLAAGTYELFTIPGEKQWTVIIHKNQSQWGAYTYDARNDVCRLTATPVLLGDLVETFTIGINDLRPSSATLNIDWEKTRVPIQITIDVRATVVPQIEAALKGEGRKPYFAFAMFYYENDLDLDRAAELMALALESAPDHIGMLYRQALILAKKGDREGAIAAAEKSLAGAASASPALKEEYIRLNTALLATLR